MRVLITGGAGFIGSHVCEALLQKGDEVFCIDNFDPYYERELKERNLRALKGNSEFQFQEADVTSADLKQLLKENNIEKVLHLAARPGVRPSISDPFVYQKINVGGTLNMLEAAVSAEINNFVYVSSSSVYGNCDKTPWKEEYEPLPASPYGASKLAGEIYVKAYSQLYGLNTSCLRYFSIYGPRQRPDLGIAKFTKAILEKEPVQMFGDGSTMRDYTYISDAVEATLSALDREFKFEVFNIGNSNPVKLQQLIKLLEQSLGKNASIMQLPEQKGDLRNTYGDISKATKLLGYSPKVRIEEGINNYVNWYLKEVK